ncbi:MAG: hypothetical protein K5663_05700 [Clostridiales bacterium]|nr:hypothetical protein [Clostridiales bacterium]
MNINIVKEIVERYGTPLYVFFEEEFKRNLLELEASYKKIYPTFQIAYSFKTNYMPAACKIALGLNEYAEVVSDLEYNMAKEYGFSPDHIIVNGPGKWNGLREMLDDGSIVMLDNAYEARAALEIANTLDHKVNVGFRLNFPIGTGKESRFGFDVDDRATVNLINYMRNCEKIRIVGLHFHLGGSRGLDAWRQRAVKIIKYADALLKDNEKKILDLGSGMFGHMNPKLAAQFNQELFTFDEYAEVVAGEFNRHFSHLPIEERPKLIVEPGSTVIANTMIYATRIIAEKTIRNRKILIVDGSVHQLGELGKKKQLPVHVIKETTQDAKESYAEVTGYTCLEDDILFRNLKSNALVGDCLIFENAGAYTNVMKPPFIQVGCGIVSFGKDGLIRIDKRQETVNDILSSYFI